jgi:hypothetical protein
VVDIMGIVLGVIGAIVAIGNTDYLLFVHHTLLIFYVAHEVGCENVGLCGQTTIATYFSSEPLISLRSRLSLFIATWLSSEQPISLHSHLALFRAAHLQSHLSLHSHAGSS